MILLMPGAHDPLSRTPREVVQKPRQIRDSQRPIVVEVGRRVPILKEIEEGQEIEDRQGTVAVEVGAAWGDIGDAHEVEEVGRAAAGLAKGGHERAIMVDGNGVSEAQDVLGRSGHHPSDFLPLAVRILLELVHAAPALDRSFILGCAQQPSISGSEKCAKALILPGPAMGQPLGQYPLIAPELGDVYPALVLKIRRVPGGSVRDAWLFKKGCNCFQIDMNRDGVVDTYDLALYTDLYERGDMRADGDGDGHVGPIDVLTFADAYEAATGP